MSGMRRWAALVVAVALVAGVAAAGVSSAGAVAAPVTAGGIRAQQPSVSGTRVVWADYRSGQWDVWLYDAAVKRARKITTGAGDKVQPAISGDTVVYVAFGDTTKGDIYAYDIPTGTTKALTTANGDQLNPVIGGSWVAWEDYAGQYNNTKVFAHNLTSGATVQVAGTSNMQFRRPKISGGILVYERVYMGPARPELPQPYYQVPGQSDILYANLAGAAATGPVYSAALVETVADERMASTDGTWVAWMQLSRDTGYDIKAKNLQTGQVVAVNSAPGEQALPIVGNGVVYWVDARTGVRISSMNLETGATGSFPFRTRADISGLAASGSALAWLQPESGRWVVKVLLGAPVPGVQLTALLPKTTVWSPFNFATLSTGGDTVSPKVTVASVEPGQTGVDGSQPLTVQFSEQMAPASVNEQSIQLVDNASGATVPADVTYSTLTKTATVKPGQRLSGSYLLQVAPSVTDRAGNAAADSYAVSFATQGAELIAAAAPNQVGPVTAKIVSESGDVQLTWEAGGDPDGDLVGYQVKRFTAATLDPATFSAAATLTPIAGPMTIVGTTATFAAASDELSRTSTYYYAVVGIDAAGNYSSVWYNISPNPHATEVNGMNTNSCLRCHSVHGAASGGMLGARGAGSCYKCHGSTDQASSVGTNSVNNIQGEFFDYPIASMTGTATEPSRHGNAYVRANADNMQCDMCHAPHKRSYNDSEPISYRKLLKRSQLSSDTSSTTLYSSDASAFGKELCYNCHGSGSDESSPAVSPYTNMYIYGGAQAFASSAGDHNQAAWDTLGTSGPAHGTQNVTDAARPLALGGSLPKNDCQVCHAEHGSESASLLAYRRSDTTTALASAGQLCFKCHSATAVAPDNAANKNAWNSRDVKAEFNRTGSTHPNSVTGSMQVPQPSLATPGTIDIATDWTTYTTRIDVDVASIPGSAVLAKGVTIDPPSGSYVFSKRAAATDFVGFAPSQAAPGAWNTDFTPSTTGAQATGAGSSSFPANGNVYVVRGGGSTAIDRYVPPAGSGTGAWTANVQALPAAPGAGSSSTINTRTAENYAYVSSGAGAATVRWWQFTGTGTGTMTLRTNGSANMALGYGSSIAFAPTANRLFAINRNSNAGDGDLFWWSAPAGSTGNLNAVSATTVDLADTSTTTTRYNKLCFFMKGGVEYLAFVGDTNTTVNGNPQLVVIGNLTGTSATITRAVQGWGSWGTTQPGLGVDVEWDGGDYLYIQRGGSTAMARWRIPTSPTTANSGTWEDLTAPSATNAGDGSSFIVQTANPASYTDATKYKPSGTVTVDNIAKAPGDTDWSSVSWQEALNGQTISMDVLDGTTGVAVPGYTGLTGGTANLAGLSNTTLDLRFTLSTGDNTVSPQIDSVNIYSSKMVAQATGATTCYNCHNTHFVSEGTAGTAWQMGRVSDPQDTNVVYGGTSTNFCLRCHGATGYNAGTGAINIAAVSSVNALIPYSIGMRPTTSWPFFNGWNKSTTGFEFTNSGHYTATVANGQALCQNCHDPHGSDFKSLTAWTRPSGATITGGNTRTRDNTTTAYVKEENLCYQCHGDGTTANKGKVPNTASVLTNVYTPASAAYGHPIGTADRHETNEDADRLMTARHAECGDCHDPHAARAGVHTTGTAAAGQVVRGATGVMPTYSGSTMMAAPASWTTTRLAGVAGSYEAYLCLKCHSSYLPNWATAAPNSPSGGYRETNIAAEFNPSNASGHNVMGDAFTKNVTNGAYTWTAPTATGLQLSAAWTVDSGMTCSDCHASNGTQARGPHGSAVPYMLKNGSTTAGAEWYEVLQQDWTNTQNMCNRCHTANPHGSWSSRSDHNRQCQHCHVAIPHGWKRPRLLHNSTDAAPYRLTGDGAGWSGVILKSYATGPTNESDCGDSCSSSRHPTNSTYW